MADEQPVEAARAKPPRFSARAHALELVAAIEHFWRSRGFPQVQAWLEEPPVYDHDNLPVFPVRSNLIAGCPLSEDGTNRARPRRLRKAPEIHGSSRDPSSESSGGVS